MKTQAWYCALPTSLEGAGFRELLPWLLVATGGQELLPSPRMERSSRDGNPRGNPVLWWAEEGSPPHRRATPLRASTAAAAPISSRGCQGLWDRVKWAGAALGLP